MVTKAPIDKNKMHSLLADIEGNVKELELLVGVPYEEFKLDRKNYGLAEHHFRRALEAILTIGTHLLSRLPAKMKDYQEVIVALGQHEVVPKEFAEQNRKLAGYRNRLVHMYWEVSDSELYEAINKHLVDLNQFREYFIEYINKQTEE